MNRKIVTLIHSLFVVLLLAGSTIFAQSDVPRKTVAITYPLGEEIKVQFRGTTRFPRLRGSANVKRINKSGTKVELTLDDMPRPYELGAAYTTFIVWAITPEGSVDKLAEIKRRSSSFFDTRIVATTPLQTFAIIVTAEPHYLAKQPSQAVIFENIAPSGNVASVMNVQYFGNSSDYFRDPRVPEIADADYIRTPVALLGARQAINLAKYTGAERDATVEFEYAQKSLEQAETAWRGGEEEERVDVLARQAIGAGARAEEVAFVRKDARLKRNEASRRDAEVRRAEGKVGDIEREMGELRAKLDRERRLRELSERDSGNFSKQITDLRQENQRLRDELAQSRAEAQDAKVRLARYEGERQVIESQREAEQGAARIRGDATLLIQSLRQFGAVRETERGITVTLPENLWLNSREMNFAQTADEKIANLASALANNPDYRLIIYRLIIESHTDNKGSASELQSLTDERARLLSEKLDYYGIKQSHIEARGMGATVPVASNATPANRAKNRRTEITLVVDNPARQAAQ